MFSFIDMVGSIRDTFTQCIKDILSMVEQVTQLSIECTDEGRLVATLMGHISKTVVGSLKSATSMPMRERGFLSSGVSSHHAKTESLHVVDGVASCGFA